MAEKEWISSGVWVCRWSQVVDKKLLLYYLNSLSRAIEEQPFPTVALFDLSKTETLLFDEYDLMDAINLLPDSAAFELVILSDEPDMASLAELMEQVLGQAVYVFPDQDSALLELRAAQTGR